MTKNFRTREIKASRTYTYAEASPVIGACEAAIRRWVKKDGLTLLATKPQHLILGADLRAFLVNKKAKRRVKVPAGHVYCLKCKQAALPVPGTAELKDLASGAKLLCAVCSHCGGRLRKTIGHKQFAEFAL